MNSDQIRQTFLDYFRSRGHRVVASSPLVLPKDPTLLFANAGMNQFKEIFTGEDERDYRTAASSQKCLRVSGKHNDLEMVGRTPRHHTFFEMLGNFSFGDYFKREAIAHAWELMREVFGVPEERLWVTVFGGSEAIPADEDAEGIWRDEVGVAADRILRCGEADNFWRMGDSGPCGPCSEIFYDLGEDLTSVEGVSNPATDDRRFIEVWNLVFMQFDQRPSGERASLPAPSIDTGMGLERICSVLQGKRSNYDTDLFTPILDRTASHAGTRYGDKEESDFSLRVIADHARAFCFLVADGVVPANDKRGYVLRRLLRRAIRHGRKLGIEGPFLQEVTPVVVQLLAQPYPELNGALDAVLEIGRREEQRFAETLGVGLGMLEESIAEAERGAEGTRVLPGTELFRLYDTFGFPLDLARDIAQERGVTIDEAGFESEMDKQRVRAQASWKAASRTTVASTYRELAQRYRTEFCGYSATRLKDAELLAILDDGRPVEELGEGFEGELILARTPFYAEAGGQLADRGTLATTGGSGSVVDVQRPVDGLSVHRVKVDSGKLRVGDRLTAAVNETLRDATRRNHTATHLLHSALREVVGTHVKQAGSLVASDRLRFDFSHFAPVSENALADIEMLVNRKVLENLSVQTDLMPIDEALEQGAMALFGEKYGTQVRVVRMGDFSMELCGGIHCARSGEIGLVKLIQERGIASGTRRIEALSGEGSLGRFREEHRIVHDLEAQFSVPRDKVVDEIEKKMELIRRYQRELEQQQLAVHRESLFRQLDDAPVVGGVKVLSQRIDTLAPAQLRELADALLQKLGSGVVVLGRAAGDKASLLVGVSRDLHGRLHAGEIVRKISKLIRGGGGGRPEMAEAGGKDAARLDDALQEAVREVARRMEASPAE